MTLIELMIVVVIIGLLASVAIPSYIRFQLRSKSTESIVNLSAIARAETAYFAEFSTYVSVSSPVPPGLPGGQRAAWPAGTEFETLGWSPEGAVLHQFLITTAPDGSPPAFTAESTGDIDLDGATSFFGYVKRGKGSPLGIDGNLPGTTCSGTGVYDPSGAGSAFDTPGPCDPLSGRSVY